MDKTLPTHLLAFVSAAIAIGISVHQAIDLAYQVNQVITLERYLVDLFYC